MVYARFTQALTNVTTNKVTQWDYGRILRIEGLKLPTAVRIDFGISGQQKSKSRIGITKDGVTDVAIPDSLLEQSKNLVAYVYVNDTTKGKTVKTINIPLEARAEPEEHDSPESKALFAEAIEMINDVAVRAENAEIIAKAHVDNARESLESTQQISSNFNETAANAVKAVIDAGTSQIQAVNNTRAEALEDIQAEGAAQVANVKSTAQGIEAEKQQIHLNNALKATVIEGTAEGEVIVLNDSAKQPFGMFHVFGKSTQDGTPTPDNPPEIVSVKNPEIRVSGKNILKHNASSQIINGISFTVNSDGSVTANGTATENAVFILSGSTVKVPAGTYVLSGCPSGGNHTTYAMACTEIGIDYGEGIAKTFEEESTLATFYPVIYKGATVKNVRFYPMLEAATIKSKTYEPYKEQQSIQLPHTLHGIPVTSGGNYTDADGQQWICDEIDLERGVLVQRIKEFICDGSTDEIWNYNQNIGVQKTGFFTITAQKASASNPRPIMCENYTHSTKLPMSNCEYWGIDTYFGLSQIAFRNDNFIDTDAWRTYLSENPIRLLYEIKEPIETALSEAEIEAFKALMTYYPNTTILNDCRANMAVRYGIDTKTYIDKKFAELQAALQ